MIRRLLPAITALVTPMLWSVAASAHRAGTKRLQWLQACPTCCADPLNPLQFAQ
jgi:hypothetical protein